MEVLEEPEVTGCVLFCMLDVLETLDVMRIVLLCMLDVLDVMPVCNSTCWRWWRCRR